MSLIHWWPLNGNTKDLGLNPISLINNGATINSAGKIGQTYRYNGGVMVANNNDLSSSTTNLTIAGWVYLNSGNYAYVFSCRQGTGGPGLFISLETTHSIFDDGTRWTTNYSIPLNTWVHFAFTRDASGKKLYINGTLHSQTSTLGNLGSIHNKMYIGRNYYNDTASTSSDVMINDFRIYNHALSAKEVKELSKGLVLHYNFEDAALSKNLATTMLPTETTLNTKANYTIVATSTTNFGLSVGDTYCWSVYVRVPTDQKKLKARVQFYNSGSDRTGPIGSTFVTNGEGLIYVTGTVLSGYARMELLIDYNSSIDVSTTDIPCYYKCGKLEKGRTTPTAWTSGSETPIVYDNSGYGNNGTAYGDLQISSDSGLGQYSVKFNGVDTAVQTPNLATMVPERVFTISGWFKHTDEWGSKTWETLYGGTSGFEIEAKVGSTNSPMFVAYNWGGSTSADQRYAYTLNVWHQFVMVRNSSGTTWYIDGVQVFTGTAGNVPSDNYFIGAWKSATQQNFKGQIADFKIYATELSAEDIKAEYNRKAAIDKNGNLFTGEFIEGNASSVKVDKSNFVTGNNIVEGTDKVKFADKYTQLEYLGFSRDSNRCCIDSGVTMQQGYTIEMSVMLTNTSSDNQFLFSDRSSSGGYFHVYINPSNYATYQTPNIGTITMVLNQKYTFTKNGTKCYVDDVYYGESGTASQTTRTLLIGGVDAADGSRGFYGRCYYFQILDGAGNLIRHFIPAKRNSDNVLGMYDLAERKFYMNAGSGTFTAGSAIGSISAIYANQIIEN